MLLADIADLVLSRACAGCARIGSVVCVECWERSVDLRCHEVEAPGLPPITVGARYDGMARDAMHALKERGVLAMADPIGAWLALAVAESGAREPLVLIPIPAHRRSMATRGVDTLDRIARQASRVLHAAGREIRVMHALQRTLDRGRQVGMSARERRVAVAGAMTVRASALTGTAGASLVVIDDVVTTGATVAEAVRALSVAGLQVAAVAAACGTPRSGQSGEAGLHALDDRVDP